MTAGSEGLSRLTSAGGDQAGLRCLLETWDTPVHCFPARPTPNRITQSLSLRHNQVKATLVGVDYYGAGLAGKGHDLGGLGW